MIFGFHIWVEAGGKVIPPFLMGLITCWSLGARLGEVEDDIRHLPTRKAFHEMELSLARYDERMDSLAKTTAATNRAVGRIEDFMIGVSKKGSRR